MDITELCVGDQILLQSSPTERQRAIVKGIFDNNQIIVKPSFGEMTTVTPEQIIKIY